MTDLTMFRCLNPHVRHAILVHLNMPCLFWTNIAQASPTVAHVLYCWRVLIFAPLHIKRDQIRPGSNRLHCGSTILRGTPSIYA